MKSIYMLLAGMIFMTSCSYDEKPLNDRIDQLEERVAQLEEICNRINSDLDALQTLIEALESRVFITDLGPLMENGVETGTYIRFSNGKSVLIHNGKDGQDGVDGQAGENEGYIPQLGMAMEDGVYYWTIDGEWLLDRSGNKIPVSGTDGRDGVDGQDGVCPLLRIVDGMWYVSYSGEEGPWIELGRADGTDGYNGQDAVTDLGLFSEIIDGEDTVTFVLKDGTTFTLRKNAGEDALQITRVVAEGYDSRNPFGVDTGILLHTGFDHGMGSITFSVTPKEAVRKIAADWKNLIKLQLFEVEQVNGWQNPDSPSDEEVELPVYDVKLLDFAMNEEDGRIYLKFSGDGLPEDYFRKMLPNDYFGCANGVLQVGREGSEVLSENFSIYFTEAYIFCTYRLTEPNVLMELPAPEELEMLVSQHYLVDAERPFAKIRAMHPDDLLQRKLFEKNSDLVKEINVWSEDVVDIEDAAFRNFKNLEEVTLSVSVVGAEAFAGSGLRYVDFYEVSEIKDRVFKDCDKLEIIHVMGPPPSLGKDVFPDHDFEIRMEYYYYPLYMSHPDWAPYRDKISFY